MLNLGRKRALCIAGAALVVTLVGGALALELSRRPPWPVPEDDAPGLGNILKTDWRAGQRFVLRDGSTIALDRKSTVGLKRIKIMGTYALDVYEGNATITNKADRYPWIVKVGDVLGAVCAPAFSARVHGRNLDLDSIVGLTLRIETDAKKGTTLVTNRGFQARVMIDADGKLTIPTAAEFAKGVRVPAVPIAPGEQHYVDCQQRAALLVQPAETFPVGQGFSHTFAGRAER